MFTHSWVLITLVGLVAVAVTETLSDSGFGGFTLGVAGALAGVILLPMATQAGLLVGSAVFGLRVSHVVIGAMRRVRSWTVGQTTVTLRALPVVLASDIGPRRQPVILRCWLAGLTSALAGVSTVVLSWLLVDGPFGRGFVIAVTPLMLYKLWPKRVPLSTSTGWLLFGLPRMPEPRRAEFRAGPVAARARAALQRGDLEETEAHIAELAAEHPDLDATTSCRVSLLEAQGEYAQGVAMLLQQISGADLDAREMSYTLAGVAGLGFSAVEAGQLPADDFLPVTKKALDDAIALGFPEFELSGSRGLLALIEGEHAEATRLAAIGSEHNTSPTSRADDFATLARAHMARHDNAAARKALESAEELAAWWPRVRETRDRLSVS